MFVSAAPPCTVPRNATEALERLRDSYTDLYSTESLTEADQAVLLAVQITLKHLKRAATVKGKA
jgi:hypothetical protein